MSQQTINPYKEIGEYLGSGLDAVITTIPSSPTIDDLVDAVSTYISGIFYSGARDAVEIELKSVARTAINSYMNSLVLSGNAIYNGMQWPFLRIMLGDMITSNLPINSIENRIGDVEDNISNSGLNVSEQRPLLIATAIGIEAAQYWIRQAETVPPISAGTWPEFFPSSDDKAVNYSYVPYWVEAANNGALSGYASTPFGLVEPTVNVMTTSMISALIGALTVTAGKVLFNWIPRIQHKL